MSDSNFGNSEDELSVVLSDIFSQCVEDPEGKVPASKLIEVLVLEHSSPEITEYLQEKLDPEGQNPLITRETLVNIVKDVMSNNNNIRTSIPSQEEQLEIPVEVITIDEEYFEHVSTEAESHEVNTLRRAYSQLQDDFQKIESAALSFESRFHSAHNDLKKLKIEMDELRVEKEELTKLFEINQDELNIKTEALKELENQVINFRFKNEKHEMQMLNLMEENSSLIFEKTKLEADLDMKSQIVTSYKNSVALLQERLIEIEERQNPHMEEIKNLKVENMAKEEEKKSLFNRISELEAAKQEMLMELLELKATKIDNCMNNPEDTSSEAVTRFFPASSTLNSISLQEELDFFDSSEMIIENDLTSGTFIKYFQPISKQKFLLEESELIDDEHDADVFPIHIFNDCLVNEDRPVPEDESSTLQNKMSNIHNARRIQFRRIIGLITALGLGVFVFVLIYLRYIQSIEYCHNASISNWFLRMPLVTIQYPFGPPPT